MYARIAPPFGSFIFEDVRRLLGSRAIRW